MQIVSEPKIHIQLLLLLSLSSECYRIKKEEDIFANEYPRSSVGASKEAVSKEDAASFLRLRRVITRYEQVLCCTCFDDRSTEVSKTKGSL